ncbi:MAG: adenylate/guanylate cyclase domain-containing protein [Pseudomonadota bacterium]
MTGPGNPASHKAVVQPAGVIDHVMSWLADQALESTELAPLFSGFCERILMVGIPIDRVAVTWPALHPMINSERLLWRRGEDIEHRTFGDGEIESEGWQRSPVRYLLHSDSLIFRRRLVGARALIDFPLLEDLAGEGYTDYFAMKTFFSIPRIGNVSTGIMASWATTRNEGFAEEELAIIATLQKEFAVAFRSSVQNDVMRTIGQVYLGPTAAERVLSGQIRRGDGREIDAVIWISDLRNSTQLSESMPLSDYLSLLDIYFECVGGAVLSEGGDILDFVGDSVVGIFPIDDDDAPSRASRAAVLAHQNAREQLERDPDLPLKFGIGITAGTVMHGNFGTPERLVFSAIGPSVNEAARIEKLTKTLEVPVLASAKIAEAAGDIWQSVGEHQLDGVSKPVPLFSADL